jgi:GTP-binding protein HflX
MTPARGHTNRQRRRLTATEVDLGRARQRALLVGTTTDESLDELALLADTAGAEVVHRELQRRTTADPATYIGKGKAEEMREVATALDVDVVIFDDELTPAQQRNLERLFAVDVVDRVALILDIFALHASSQEGAVQVELAQLRYRLPRLRGRGTQLSQQGAGIGTRGPGETQLEVDRRRLLRRIQKLERDLRELAATRATQRKARRRRDLPQVALVGYTNAGKSTLLNRLTDAGVLVQDQLFSTLDPTVRRLRLRGGETVLLSDTVGFVRRLPHQLVEAFRSTLEEVRDADLLLHVVDASASDTDERMRAVDAVLREIDAADVPRLLAWNKCDIADRDDAKALLAAHPGSVACSAATGEGVAELLDAIGDRLRALARVVELVVPYDRGDVLAALHRAGEVLVEVHDEHGTRVRARLPASANGRFAEFAVAAE